MNPPLGKALDAQVESLLGKTLLELGVAGDSRRRLEDSIARAFDEGVPNTLECTWSTAGGERTFEVRNFPERDDAGRTTSVLGVARDITEYRRVEEALRRPLRTNEAMFSQAITCFALLDRDYRFIRVNESFAREYQRDAHEFVGRRLGELLPAYAADDDRQRRLLDDLVLSKRPAQFSSWPYEFVDQPVRSTTYWDWILQPILDEHGEVEFVFVSGIDVTERRRAEVADRLVARGPTLSADGEQHTGSVHIVALADADAARSFVADEPYNRAGLYAEHAIVRFVNLLGRTMWERPPAPDVPQSTFVIARWPAIPAGEATIRAARDAVRARPDTWIFLGLLVTEDGGRCVGVAAAADASAHDAEVALRGVLRALQQERAPAEIHRWQRGGRR